MPTPPPPSLVERARARLSQGGGNPRAGWAVALLLAAAPLGTLAGANMLAARARADILAVAPVTDDGIAVLVRRPGIAATLEALARALPADATLLRAEMRASGALSIDVLTPDPDRLRGALRRDAMTAALREGGQRAGDGGIVVTLETRA